MSELLCVLDLFSGIGGFSLGLERTGGFKTVAFCEIDKYCQRILAKHWPEVPIYGDIRRLGGFSVDVVCGGFPCQPFSSASRGRSLGTEDDRYLWPEMCRVIQESRPAWVIGENVADLDRVALEQVVLDLDIIGYDVQTFEIPACAVGHDHWRRRLWILGHSHGDGKPRRAFDAKMVRVPRNGKGNAGEVGEDDGLSTRMDRLRALGNAVVPQIPELIGRAILMSEAAS